MNASAWPGALIIITILVMLCLLVAPRTRIRPVDNTSPTPQTMTP